MNETSPTQTCSRCGATVTPGSLGGLCPRCLLALNLGSQSQTEGPEMPCSPGGAQRLKPPPLPAPAPGEIAPFFPQLEILSCLGSGGMGAVYKARQPKLDRYVALKILLRRREDGNAEPGFADRFGREARALARLNHPDIVAVYDYGEAGGYPFLILEYVDGLTLRQLLQRGRLAPEEALAIVPKICEALQFAHERGVVHRDIKPENILLDKQGRVKIADFGIAKIVAPEVQDLSLTGGKDVVGTPMYMAPEQVEQPAKVDHRADIFSLGVVFYEMLTGELPLGKFAPPSRRVQVDVRLDEVVLRALEKEPTRRYQHASEVKSDVETIATTAGTPGSPPAPGSLPAAPIFIKRWRDCWPWDTAYLGVFLFGPAALAGLLVLWLMPRLGLKALWFFALEWIGIVLALTYAVVGHRVRKLKAALPKPAGGEVAEALMFRRPFQAPGLAILHPDRLELIPIVRSPFIVPLEEITTVSEVRWFNGTRLWTKRGFVLETAAGQRIGVAVPEPFGCRWRARLSRGSLPEVPAGLGEQRGSPSAGSRTRRGLAWGGVGLVTLALLLVGSNLLWSCFTRTLLVTITGTVTDAVTGRPVANARVDDNGYGAGPSQAPRQAWTDAQGHYHLQTAYEEHGIAASAPGYEPSLATLLTKPFGVEQQVRMDFQLQPAPGAPSLSTSAGPSATAARFGPITECVLHDLDEGRGNEALSLRTGQRFSLPADFRRRAMAERQEWLDTNAVDLLVDLAKGRWALMTCDTKLGDLAADQWERTTATALEAALAAGTQRLEGRTNRSGTFYLLSAQAELPLSFAFKTRQGDFGVLQITGSVQDPNGLRLRFKLLEVATPLLGRPTGGRERVGP